LDRCLPIGLFRDTFFTIEVDVSVDDRNWMRAGGQTFHFDVPSFQARSFSVIFSDPKGGIAARLPWLLLASAMDRLSSGVLLQNLIHTPCHQIAPSSPEHPGKPMEAPLILLLALVLFAHGAADRGSASR
jgi:hypothetical protein